jgi:FKBP-type peptidyl-prolyl cis-trans isomerase FkpA
MKQILFTLLLFCTVGLFSCRKSNNDIDIKQFDDQQIKDYIAANGLTGMTRDLTGGDTTGIYYKILSQGAGATIDYSTPVAVVFTIKSLDGKYNITDTLGNHIYNFAGHITQNGLPEGFELAVKNILKTKGTRARVIVPSRLGYGAAGHGSGSTTSGNRVAGNQSLDFYINVINTDKVTDPISGLKVSGLDVYDDICVKTYITANNLTGYTKTASGLWYKITQQGTGAAITTTSVVTAQYTSLLFDGSFTDDAANSDDATTGASIDMSSDPRRGFVEGLQLVTPGAKLSLIMPSRLAFGSSQYDTSMPVFSCLRYELNILSVQ